MEPSFADMLSSSAIDVNRNIQQQKSDGSDDIPAEKINRFYSINLSLQQQLLVTLLVDGCRSGKLTFSALRDYLDENSWIAQPMTETDFDGNIIQYTWQDLLYPALTEFFKQLSIIVHEAPDASPSFVLCLDSLTLKIEGMLSELLQRSGDPTITTHKKGDLREVYFEDLVDMAKERGLLTENEAYFFRYVFTGLSRNIRNDIAHSYYHLPVYYSLANTVLVFVAALRLFRFKLTSEPAP
ncbi:hypothetical protein [Pontibacter pamirensis]|uniref:hypothetical protein n=1 Tax=Pontibacter pamirensis TaxID=2562824 RepID=UPI00138A398F|nr:hypothetical protein [Pontibacter pamirensis]